MNRSTAVRLSLLTFALAVASFVLLGLGRLALGHRTAMLLAAPVATVAVLLAAVLFVRFTLDALGVWPVEGGDD